MKRKKSSRICNDNNNKSSSSNNDDNDAAVAVVATSMAAVWKPIDLSELTLLSDTQYQNYSSNNNTNTNHTISSSSNKSSSRGSVSGGGGNGGNGSTNRTITTDTTATTNTDQNHYDNDHDDDTTDNHEQQQQQRSKQNKRPIPRLTSNKVVERDLLGQPQEPMGIFYRLEVMDGVMASSLCYNSNKNNNNKNSNNKNSNTITNITSDKNDTVKTTKQQKPQKEPERNETAVISLTGTATTAATISSSSSSTNIINNNNKTTTIKKTTVKDKKMTSSGNEHTTSVTNHHQNNSNNNKNSMEEETEEDHTKDPKRQITSVDKKNDNHSTTTTAKDETKKKKRSITNEIATDIHSETTNPETETMAASAAAAAAAADNDTAVVVEEEEEEAIRTVQEVWYKECQYAVQLHVQVCHTLVRESFGSPTMIQSLSLPSTTTTNSDHQKQPKYSNLIGAAPTGSGKTLAFLIPIFHTLFTRLDTDTDTNDGLLLLQQQQQQPPPPMIQQTLPLPLQALIVTPTRELALQIYQVGMKFCISPSTNTTATTSTSRTAQKKVVSLYSHVSIACITGGLASAKQIRILQSKYRPPTIIVGTPGRLWELLSSRQYPHLNDLSQLRFLIIDEADQMIDMKLSYNINNNNSKNRYKKFPELIHILDAIHEANPMIDDNDDNNEKSINDDTNDDDDDAMNMDMNRMLGLPGIPGEARVTMMNDTILQQIREQQEQPIKEASSNNNDDDVDDEEEEDILIVDDDDRGIHGENDEDEDDDISLPPLPPVHRRTFVFSATLTLPDSIDSNTTTNTTNNSNKRNRETKHDKNKTKHKKDELRNVHGAIADLLRKAHAVGRTKVIDLTNSGTVNNNSVGTKNKLTPTANVTGKLNSETLKQPGTTVPIKNQFQFPPGLQFQHILCTQRHKDSHLYGYILYFMSSLQQQQQKQSQQSSLLIFCNSIAAVRRVGMTLTTLRLPVRILHAQMQQRARFKAVESLVQHDTDTDLKMNHLPTIVVATDVAARGLDIPSVATVIHYDAARTVDTFIHRSGRTARGVGDGAIGCSLSIVASGEDQFHNKLTKSLNVPFKDVPIDGRLLRIAQERVNLACKVATADDTDRKNQRDDQWFLDQAKQAGLEVDDDLLNNATDVDGVIGVRRNKDSAARMKARQNEAEISRKGLNELLNQPVQTQRYGKFLSTQMIQQQTHIRTSAVAQHSSSNSSPVTVQNSNTRKQKRQRR